MNFEIVQEKIDKIYEEQNEIRNEISKLNEKLNRKKFEEFLLKKAKDKPILIPATKNFKEYMYITSPLKLFSCEIAIYPVWIDLECVFPPWSENINNIFIQMLKIYNNYRDREIFIDAISRALNIDYSSAKELQELYKIIYTDIYKSELDFNENIKIYFEKYEALTFNSNYFKKKSFLNYPGDLIDTPIVNLSVAKVKFLLILPLSIDIDNYKKKLSI